MLEWIYSNLSVIIICVVVFTVIILDIIYLIRTKKKGKSLCGGNCSGCAMCGECHSDSIPKNINSESKKEK